MTKPEQQAMAATWRDRKQQIGRTTTAGHTDAVDNFDGIADTANVKSLRIRLGQFDA